MTNYFVTNGSRRRYLAAQKQTSLYKSAPSNLQDKYCIFIDCGDGAVFHDDDIGYDYPKTFKQWLAD